MAPPPPLVQRRHFLRAAGVCIAVPLLGSLSSREKLGEYLHAVREVEQQLVVPFGEPVNTNLVDDLPLLYDLIALALQTGSTRIATLEIGGDYEAAPFGIKKGYHALSHHGQLQENVDSLLTLEEHQMTHFARFLAKLKSIPDGDGTLLDHTMVLFGSGMANANAHTDTNLPIILAGGGFPHGEYKAFPTSGPGRLPLSNLYLTLLQRSGVETHRFATSTGALS